MTRDHLHCTEPDVLEERPVDEIPEECLSVMERLLGRQDALCGRFEGEERYPTNCLQRWRSRLGMKQYELADKAGLSRSHLSLLESGIHEPTPYTRLRLLKALGLTRLDLLRVWPREDTE